MVSGEEMMCESECFHEGSNGNCGPNCPMFIRGDCPIEDEIREELGLGEEDDG